MSIKRIFFVALLLTMLLSVVPGATAASGTWQLVDTHACRRGQGSYRGGLKALYGINLQGSWSKAINVGASNLPAGFSAQAEYAPIQPGSSDGSQAEALVQVTAPFQQAHGVYTITLWASDGTNSQSVPVRMIVGTSDSCHGY